MAYSGKEPKIPIAGGTGVANANTSTITLGGAFLMSGPYTFTGVLTGTTSVTFPTVGTLATTSQLPILPLSGANGGTGIANTGLTISLSGGSTGYYLRSDSSGNATWQAGAASSISITGDSGGALSGNAFTLTGGTTGLTFAGAGSTETLSGTLKLANGGTNANLTASNGGIFYSTASAGAILSGTATANQMLLSGSSTTPAWSTATYPATTTVNQLLYSSSNNVIAGITAGDYGVLISSSSGAPSWLANGITGQVLTATTSGIASWENPANSGTVTTVSVVTANGFAGTVANATSTPAITLTTSQTGVLSGNGTAISGSAVTQYDVLVGGASNAISSVGPGSSGQLLQSKGNSSNPAYTTATYPSTAGSSGNVLTSDGTNWNSSAPSGGITPVFLAYVSSGATYANSTGDGTFFNIVYDTTYINTGSAYNTSTGTFTAPKTGCYLFVFNIGLTGVSVSNTTIQLNLSSGNSVLNSVLSPATLREIGDGSGNLYYTVSQIVYYTATSTDTFYINISGSATKNVSLVATSNSWGGFFIG